MKYDINSPITTIKRKSILKSNQLLRQIYTEWYACVNFGVPKDIEGIVLELGSGAGFIKEIYPNVKTSDVLMVPDLDIVFDALKMPFASHSLKTIMMVNVLHHLHSPEKFFNEATRCVIKNGTLVMIEPWVTKWSSFVYKYLHHEPFNPDSIDWGFPPGGVLSQANSAMPWILFDRDRDKFQIKYPQWRINKIEVMQPFRYLLSGGMVLPTLVPKWSYGFWKKLESSKFFRKRRLGMFAYIELRKIR